jgi:hypothetical protein
MMTQRAMTAFCIVMLVFGVVAIILASIALNNSSNNTTTTLTPEQLVLLENLGNNTNITSTGCLSAKCFTDDYVAPNVPGTFFSTSEGNVTCQTLESGSLASATLDNTGILTIGDTNATAITIGQSLITTTVLGDFVSTVPYGSIDSTANVQQFLSPTFTPLRFVEHTLGTLVQFSGGDTDDLLQYQGSRPRTFNVSYNIRYPMPSDVGEILLFTTGINGVPSTSTFAQSVTSSGNQWITSFSNLVLLHPLDTITLMVKYTISSNFVLMGASIIIHAID